LLQEIWQPTQEAKRYNVDARIISLDKTHIILTSNINYSTQ